MEVSKVGGKPAEMVVASLGPRPRGMESSTHCTASGSHESTSVVSRHSTANARSVHTTFPAPSVQHLPSPVSCRGSCRALANQGNN
ncbi:hypothetical protein E2C01_008428 [Portunus trituberculatus]|uniref:Uncharacterized protein n=1 Tax=Portunus trituberculatus TaxID=210409 RepID=A0A5B7D1S1_PORTR|nr:hypothetical protein [Portunus trituberculatus]